jgi:hypothetical protein
MKRKHDLMESLSEDVLRHVAKIMGPMSAAQEAIDDAQKRRADGQVVEFFRSMGGAYIIVRGMK